MLDDKHIKHMVAIRLKYWLDCRDGNKRKIILDKNKKYVFIMCAADYENLGDIAITEAQYKILKEMYGPDYDVVRVPVKDVDSIVNAIKKLSIDNVIVTIIGGGNSGTLYEFIERKRRYILKELSEYSIISFPQSIYYEKNIRGEVYKKEFIRLCNKCSRLVLLARDKNSYAIYKTMGLKCMLVPDSAFMLEFRYSIEKKNSIAWIFRNDKEKGITNEDREAIISSISNIGLRIENKDTCDITVEAETDLQKLLNSYISEISKMKLVITDRLHGMILAIIAGTPCIVFDNNNGKIESLYNTWLYDFTDGVILKKGNCLDIYQDACRLIDLDRACYESKRRELLDKVQKVFNSELSQIRF